MIFFSSLEYTGSDPLELFNVKNENADGEDDRFSDYKIIFEIWNTQNTKYRWRGGQNHLQNLKYTAKQVLWTQNHDQNSKYEAPSTDPLHWNPSWRNIIVTLFLLQVKHFGSIHKRRKNLWCWARWVINVTRSSSMRGPPRWPPHMPAGTWMTRLVKIKFW